MIIQVILNGLTMSLTYILIALGFSLVFGIARIFNFAHGEMYMLGAWAIAILFGRLGLNYGVAFAISTISVGGIGVLLYRLFFRPLRGKGAASMNIALGLQLLISALALIVFGEKDIAVKSPITGVTTIGNSTISNERMAVVLISLVLLIGVFLFVRTTKMGLAMRAVPQNTEGALLLGVNVDHMSYFAFFFGSFLASAAGGLLGPLFYVNSFLGPWALFKAVIVVALGGVGSIGGAVAAGFMIGFLEALTQHFFGSIMAELGGFMLIILVLLVRPKGLLGHEVI